MARSNEPNIDDPGIFFRQANAGTIARILERADRNAARAGKRQHAGIQRMMRPRKTLLGKALGLALAHHGRSAKGRASIRQTAPGTGGRPYHFGFTTVTKGQSARGGKPAAGRRSAPGADASPSGGGSSNGGPGRGGSSPGTAGGGSPTGKPGAPTTREGAHQTYAERYAALAKDPQPLDQDLTAGQSRQQSRGQSQDQDFGPEIGRGGRSAGPEPEEVAQEPARRLTEQGLVPTPAVERDEPDRDSDRGPAPSREWIEREMGQRPGISERHTEAAAQAYIEDPAKVQARLHGNTVSFGTIGDTMEKRQEFWELVHKHESVDGRTQSRLVLELPHEADAKARHEIVRRYVKEFEDKGVPYWAAIHAPTKKNDDRNHHAHIVFIDRPARQIPHPETGEMVWDFTVEQLHRTKTSGNIRRTYPYRQNRDPEMRSRGYIKVARARFSDITNAVMEKHGVGVRYDPRSYKDMGLDVKPMEHVARILTDKSRTQAFAVMDPEWTRKMIDAEMAAAALRRDETYQALRRTEDRLQEATRSLASLGKANAKLPRRLRLSPGHMLGRKVAGTLAAKWMEVERNRLATRFVEESTIRTLDHVIDATTPRQNARGLARNHASANAPDADDMREINLAAREELAAYQEQRRRSRSRYSQQESSIFRQWDEAAAPPRAAAPPPAAARGPTPARPEPPTPQAPPPTANRPAPGPQWSAAGRMPPEMRAALDGRPAGPQPAPRPATQAHGRTPDQTASRPFPGQGQNQGRAVRPAPAVHPIVASIMAAVSRNVASIIQASDGPGSIGDTAAEFLERAAATTAAFKAMFGTAPQPPQPGRPGETRQSAEGRARTEAAAGRSPARAPAADARSAELTSQGSRAAAPPPSQRQGAAAEIGRVPSVDRPAPTRAPAPTRTVPSAATEAAVGRPAARQQASTPQKDLFGQPGSPTGTAEPTVPGERSGAPATTPATSKTTNALAPETSEAAEGIEAARKKRRRAVLARQARSKGGFDL